MHAIEILLDDHETVAGLFDRVRDSGGRVDHSLFEKIKTALDVHKHIEESLFYPKLVDAGDDALKDAVNAAKRDHRQVRTDLDELSELDDGDDKFDPKLKLLIEDVERHVEEEEGRMFPLVEDQLDEDALEELGAEMEAEKNRYQSERYGSIVL